MDGAARSLLGLDRIYRQRHAQIVLGRAARRPVIHPSSRRAGSKGAVTDIADPRLPVRRALTARHADRWTSRLAAYDTTAIGRPRGPGTCSPTDLMSLCPEECTRGPPCTSKDPATAAPCGSASRRRTPIPSAFATARSAARPRARGGFAINLGADAATLKVEGEEHVRTYHARLHDEGDAAEPGRAQVLRHVRLGALALGPALAGSRASARLGDRHAPAGAARAHPPHARQPRALGRALRRAEDKTFDEYPDESLADWHRRLGLEG